MQSAPPAEPVELDLLRSWREPISPGRIVRDVAGSLCIHALILAFVILAPDIAEYQESPQILAHFNKPTILFAPPMSELTQKAPNQGKVLKQLDVRSAVQAQPAQAPRVRQFIPPPGPTARAPEQAGLPAPQIDVPQIQSATEGQAPSVGANTPGFTAPTNLGAAPRVTPPTPAKAPQAAKAPSPVREALRSGGGGLIVGDISEDSPRVPGVNPSTCNDCSALQLLSDPKNVDFKPYLLQVLAMVKSHWMSVIPESARMGRRGIVVVKFAIDRRGAVPELEFTSPNGGDLDRAAVAGISASVPFPALPAEYGGDKIRLQMAFSYNPPSR